MARIVAGVIVAALLGATVHAHHSFSAYYFESQSVTIEGEVIEFDYTAPHAWLHVLAPDPQGTPRRYSAEWSNPSRLARDKVTKDTLQPGDRVTVTGSPGRKASEYRIHLKRIERPADGWKWEPPRRRR